MVNVIKPGAMLTLPAGADTATLAAMAQQQQSGWDILLHLVPTSVVDAMARATSCRSWSSPPSSASRSPPSASVAR